MTHSPQTCRQNQHGPLSQPHTCLGVEEATMVREEAATSEVNRRTSLREKRRTLSLSPPRSRGRQATRAASAGMAEEEATSAGIIIYYIPLSVSLGRQVIPVKVIKKYLLYPLEALVSNTCITQHRLTHQRHLAVRVSYHMC